MELIPAIDLKDGRCVRLLHGDFAAETRYDWTADALYDRYFEFGARTLHVVDLDGARNGNQAHREIIGALARRRRLTLQVGGGLRDQTTLVRALDDGVDRAVIGSTAVTNPDLVEGWLRQHGPERIVLAFDVRVDDGGVPRLTTHGWQTQSSLSLWDGVARFGAAGLLHVLCTDVSRDGALSGPNLDLYVEAVRRYPAIRWQASGGVRDARDLWALADAGVTCAISGRALLEDRIPREELQPFLPAA